MAGWYPWIVLVHLSCAIVFIGAVRAGKQGGMDSCRFRHTHRIVLARMAVWQALQMQLRAVLLTLADVSPPGTGQERGP